MPIYEYLCVTCHSYFEKLQKAGAADAPECPVCGSAEVKRELSTFSSAASCSSLPTFRGG